MKISILGLNASGKSTLASRISENRGLPCLHIDRIWFESGGYGGGKTTPLRNKQIIRATIKNEVVKFLDNNTSWVTDGVYIRVQNLIASQADQIVFLNIPTYIRLINHLKRTVGNKRHKELTLVDDIKFFKDIFTRARRTTEKIQLIINKYPNKVIELNSYRDIDNYLRALNKSSQFSNHLIF